MHEQIELNSISKQYGALWANKNINLKIKPRSIHALLGENGAGKSTLVNIIYGLIKPDEGQILWEGKPMVIESPSHARSLGIGVVFQHFSLFETMTVLENIALGINYLGKLKQLKQEIQQISTQYQLQIDTNAVIADLSEGEKQRVEIIRCLLQQPKLLILDEPTSVLTPLETEHLFTTLRKLRDEGCAILFIGHKLDDIKALCDHATVIRRGSYVAERAIATTEISELIELMIGESMGGYKARRQHSQPETIFRVVSTIDNPVVNEASPYNLILPEFHLKSGIITGIAGISGNGQETLMAYLSGELRSTAESLQFFEQNIGNWGVRKRNKSGILNVPTERIGRSAVGQISLLKNALLGVSDTKNYVNKGLIKQKKLASFANEIIETFDVKASGNQALASSLSGGNLQKFIVGRSILQAPKVLLIANPTWGVDINAAMFIRNSLIQLRDRGVAILLLSEDLEEMFVMCDEMAVINRGRLSSIQPIETLSTTLIGKMMTD